MAEMISAAVQRDIEDIGKSINTDAIITPRVGEPFESIPMVSRKALPRITNLEQEKANKVEVADALSEKVNTDDVYLKSQAYSIDEVDQVVQASELNLQTQIAAVGVGNKAYKTYALMDADKANIPAKSKVTVTNDATASNNGDWQWDGVAFTKSSFDPLTQSKNYVDSFATVKSKTINDENLDVFTNDGNYVKPFGGGIPTDFATLNYPEKNAGVLNVVTNKQSSANLQIKQTYAVFANSNVYTRQKIGSTAWTSWELTPRKADIDSAIAATSSILAPVITWQNASANARVSYDPSTKIVTINGYIIGSYGKLASRRIRLTASSAALLTFTISTDWAIIWLDLNALPADGNITADNYSSIIKVGGYDEASAVRFTGAASQVALMKYDYLTNRVEAAAGFVDVINPSADPDEIESSDYFDFDKTDKRLNVYLPTSSGEKIRVGLLHQINAADNTASVGSNSDLWRIYTAHLCDTNFNVGTQIVNEGEWECAIYHTNDTQAAGVTKDFVGGYHGDELLTDVYFLVNGVRKNQDFTVTGKAKSREITLVQKSIIYFQGTNTPLAEHLKIVNFTKDAINVKQQLKVLTEVTVNPFYMCMLPIMRLSDGIQVTDASSRSDDYFISIDDNSVGGLPRRYSTVDKPLIIRQWGTATGFSSKTTIHKMTQLVQTNNAFIQLLTSGASYNKLYVSPTNVNTAYTIAANTVLESDVTYQLDKTS